MSWETMSKDEYPCPCGKGSYEVTVEMDDWNRTRECWIMTCSSCKEKYSIQSEGAIDSGISYTRNFWAKNENILASEKLTAEYKKLLNKIRSISNQKYLKQWKSLFEGSSKKAIWAKLTDNGAVYPALGTFYSHIKHEGLERYLERFLENNLFDALDILEVSDHELVQLSNESKDLELKAKKILKET